MSPRVIPFPSPGSRDPKSGRGSRYSAFGIGERLYVFLTTITLVALVGYLVYWPMRMTPLPFDILFGLMVLYWAFIHQQIQKTGFLKKNWIVLLIVGVLLAFVHPYSAAAMLLSSLLYVCFFLKSAYGPSSFVRYHLLTLLITVSTLSWLGVFVSYVSELGIFILQKFDPAFAVNDLAQSYLALGYVGILGLIGIVLGVSALLDKTPNLPFASLHAHYWA